MVMALPFLTRIYSPEEFSQLASYAALLAIFGNIACLRFEIAIPLAAKDDDAINLLVIALCAAVCTALLLGIIILIGGASLLQPTGQTNLLVYQWLLPFGVWLMGSYAALQYWGTRQRLFNRIAITRLSQIASGISAQLVLGIVGLGAMGLLIGHTLVSGVGIFSLGRYVQANVQELTHHVSRNRIKALIKKYYRFPTYAVCESLADNGAQQLPILIIAALAFAPEAGFVLLAMRTLGMPLNLIGAAIGQVYLAQANGELERGTLAKFTLKTVGLLAAVGLPLMILVALVAPTIFAFAFGANWERAGELVVWMTPWFLIRLCSAPIVNVMHLKMMQDRLLYLTLFGLCMRVLAVILALKFFDGYSAEAFAVSGAIYYTIALVVFCNAAGVFGLNRK